MTLLYSTVRRVARSLTAALSLLLAILCAGHALAAPMPVSGYQVSIDTTALAGKNGYLDFLMLGLGSAAPVQASISHFTGAYASEAFLYGDASGSIASGVTLGNGAAWNEFGQWASFGGLFTFQLSFNSDGGLGDGTTLGISLLDEHFNYLGFEGDVVTFALQPGVQPVVGMQDGVASVSDAAPVPEPATMSMVAAGLVLLVRAGRRGRQR